MSINRTRWLDNLRPAGASSGGWTEGPMAPVETTDAATVDQRCSFKHWTGWRHNRSNSKLCVAMRMGQANLFRITNFRLCAGAMLSSQDGEAQKRADLFGVAGLRFSRVIRIGVVAQGNLCIVFSYTTTSKPQDVRATSLDEGWFARAIDAVLRGRAALLRTSTGDALSYLLSAPVGRLDAFPWSVPYWMKLMMLSLEYHFRRRHGVVSLRLHRGSAAVLADM